MFDFKTAEFLEATRRMVECLDPIVALEETLIDLFTLKDPQKSTFFLVTTSLAILYLEAAIALSLLAIMLTIQYNAYYRRVYQPHSETYIRNAQMLLFIMNTVTDATDSIQVFVRDVIFWGKPDQSVLMMNISLFGSITVYISLHLLPLRALTVAALWIATLRNSEFFNSLGVAILKRLQKVDYARLQAQLITTTLAWKTYLYESAKSTTDTCIVIY